MQAHNMNLCHFFGFICGEVLRHLLYTCPSLLHLSVTSHKFSCAAFFPGPFWEWVKVCRYPFWCCSLSPYLCLWSTVKVHFCFSFCLLRCAGLPAMLDGLWLDGWCPASRSINPISTIDRKDEIKLNIVTLNRRQFAKTKAEGYPCRSILGKTPQIYGLLFSVSYFPGSKLSHVLVVH